MEYKIGPVILSVDRDLSTLQDFKYSNRIHNLENILQIQLVDSYDFPKENLLVFNDTQFKISKITLDGHEINWVFESKPGGMSYLIMDSNYENVVYYSKFHKNNRCYDEDLGHLLKLLVKCRMIIENNSILHASCISLNNEAIIFSASSGVGKSTRAKQFIDTFGAEWISGDRPSIDCNKGIAYGVPWDGKEGIFVNKSANLSCIFEIHRAGFTYMKKMNKQKVFSFLLKQLFVPMWDEKLVKYVFVNINQLIERIQFYELYCDQTQQASLEIYYLIKEIFNKNIGDINMKLKKDFRIMHVGDDYMAIPVGKETDSFNGVVSLSEAAAYLLENMATSKTEEEIVDLLLKEYNVDIETAKKDVHKIIKTFKEIGLIEE